MVRLLKFILRCYFRLFYGVKVTGLSHYFDAGDRVLIVSNHTSLLDGVLLYAFLPETPTFAINTQIAGKPEFRFYLKLVNLFIMDPTSALSIKSMIKFIREDNKAVIFPEGRITTTGVLMKVYEGPGLIAEKTGAMVLPISIDGAHLSPYSYLDGLENIRRFPKITINILPPERITINHEVSGHANRMAAAQAMQDIMFRIYYSTYDFNKTLFEALLEASKKNGKKQVVLEDMNNEPLSYKNLITRIFILGRLLRKDTGPGEHVGLLLPNVNATIICFMALQFLGRVTAMLNFTSGLQAILRACNTADIKTVYTSRRFIENAKLEHIASELEAHINLVYLEDLRSQLSLFDKLSGVTGSLWPNFHYRRYTKDTDPCKPAVILFTSGSEGNPKGVVLSHANLLSNYAQVRCHINFNKKDIVFACLPLFHSFGLNAGCLMPLIGGSKVFLYPTPLHYHVIPELIYELGATILFATSTFFKGYSRYANQYDFHSLRFAVAGAEKLREDTIRIWMEKFGIRIYQGYGVSEASPVISVNTPVTNRSSNTVGPILPGMDYYLEGIEGIEDGGKLVVSGPNIMVGYLLHDQPGKIIPPVTDKGDGWHDTGDIAAVDEDGHINILGRAKRFAKIAGEMVSLTAIEELAMETWPKFNHAAINLPDDRKGEKIVLVTDNKEANRKQIQEKAKELKYGELFIPRKVILAEELPLLSTGKIDYINLTKLVLKEDQEGTGWISKLTHLITGHDEKEESREEIETSKDETPPSETEEHN